MNNNLADRSPKNLGRLIATIAIAGALVLVAIVVETVNSQPRTHNAFLYADSAALTPEVSGQITALHVQNNQRVAKSDKLVEIDPEPFQLRVDQAKAQVAALQAQVSLTSRQVEAQGSGANAAKSQAEKAEAQLALARDTLSRLTPLLSKGYVTAQQVDEARSNQKTAEASLIAAQQQANQANQNVGDTDSLSAQLKGAQAALALAQRDLRNTVIVAPFDGLVTGLDIAEGSYAAAGHPIFSLIKANDWYAVGNFRETELSQIASGDVATVWLMADSHHPIKAHVESLGWGVKPEDGGGPSLPTVGRTLNWVVVAQRFPVRVKLENPPQNEMRVGETVSIVVRHDDHR